MDLRKIKERWEPRDVEKEHGAEGAQWASNLPEVVLVFWYQSIRIK